MAVYWSKDLETGNAQIDSEHQTLLKAADDLIDACTKGKGREAIGPAVDFLVSYTKTHFTHEQGLQLKYNFPEYPNHVKWHQTYVADMEALAVKIKKQGPTIAMVAEVNMEISKLLTHIKTMDVRLAKHIKSVSGK